MFKRLYNLFKKKKNVYPESQDILYLYDINDLPIERVYSIPMEKLTGSVNTIAKLNFMDTSDGQIWYIRESNSFILRKKEKDWIRLLQ